MVLPSTPVIDTIIVSDNVCFTEHLTAFLRQSTAFCFRIRVVTDSNDSTLHTYRLLFSHPPLILFAADLTRPESLAVLSALAQSFPGCLMVAIGEMGDLGLLLKYIRIGVRGFIPASLSASAFNEALIKIIGGEAFISTAVTGKIFDYLHHNVELTGKLTHRQQQIVEGIVEGLSYKLIAHKYQISIDTVREHIKNIYKTFRINSKAELITLLKFHYL
ncbi:response regulator transcription factor [Niabella sp. CC-SYL272]|uniref:helix-turn-helix transcriptional regulator n=1 Tax=Niabella agricola TaxID=2891571 RepID=UPI001F1ECB73|nr:response regulator transcription factor [Niabella agricola]MCF3110864.1 response regulator transcription factor [Niabella agricola]